MTAVSSFKPLDLSPAVARNQVEANRSWNEVFDGIVYFNTYEPRLASGITTFTHAEDFPTIREIAEFCGAMTGWSCIVNADIIVTDAISAAEVKLNIRNALSASSLRLNFDVDRGLKSGRQTDLGLDIFIARPGIWREAARVVPEELRLGHGLWDTWMTGFLITAGAYYDLTPLKCVYHPNHEDRNRPHIIPEHLKQNEFVRKANLPQLSLFP